MKEPWKLLHILPTRNSNGTHQHASTILHKKNSIPEDHKDLKKAKMT